MRLPRLAKNFNRLNFFGVAVLMMISLSCPEQLIAGEQTLISVLNPTGYAPPIERKPMAARPAGLAGKTIYLVDLTFDNGDVFLKEMQKWFTANMPGVKTEFRAKKGAYYTDDPELWTEIKSAHGLMIMAIGH